MLRMLTVAVLTGIGTLSDVQTQVLQRARDRTPEISAGEQKLLALLRSEATQAYLRQFDDGSKLHELDPLVLFRRLISELDASEVVHNFEVAAEYGDDQGMKPFCGQDAMISFGTTLGVWPGFKQSRPQLRRLHRLRGCSEGKCWGAHQRTLAELRLVGQLVGAILDRAHPAATG